MPLGWETRAEARWGLVLAAPLGLAVGLLTQQQLVVTWLDVPLAPGWVGWWVLRCPWLTVWAMAAGWVMGCWLIRRWLTVWVMVVGSVMGCWLAWEGAPMAW